MIEVASIQALPLSFVKPILAILAHEQEEAISFGPLYERAQRELLDCVSRKLTPGRYEGQHN